MKVRYYGHVGSLSGYGRAAADNCMALLSTGKVELEISPIDYKPDQARIALAGAREVLVGHMRRQPDLSAPDIVIIHTLPGDVVKARTILDNTEDLDCPFVAYTTWEGDTASPDVVLGYSDFDEVWVPSFPCLNALMDATIKVEGTYGGRAPRLRLVPHSFDPATLDARRTVDRDDRDGFAFYYMGAWNGRKNVAGLIRAWALAFDPNDKASLLLHCPLANRESYQIAIGQTGLSPVDMAPIVFSNQYVSDAEIVRMHGVYDCFVTAARGEAWNYPCFDAVLAGRHVIAPAGLGSDEYLIGTTARRISGTVQPASVDVQVSADGIFAIGAQKLSSHSLWTEPSLVELAHAMRHAYDTGTRHLDAPADSLARFTYRHVGELALQALEDL